MSRPDLFDRLALARSARVRDGLLRQVRTIAAIDGPRIVVDGKTLLNFAGNDYLGLAQHPALREAFMRTAERCGVGASAAHLLGGHRDEHAALEAKLAQWTGRERALLFSTGYMANLGVMQALLRAGDLCLQDRLNHASLIDGARQSGAQLKRYLHGNIASADHHLAGRPDAPALLATDGVFSMDGDVAPLCELATLCTRQNVTFMVDDAHGLGVLGTDGAGSVAEASLTQADVPVLMATLGKALGVAGAFVAGSAALIDGLAQFARTYCFTTAPPPALAAAAAVAVDLARTETWRRYKLQASIAQFRAGAATRGLALPESRTPIQPLLVGASDRVLRISRQMENAGFYTPAIRPPTVPTGKARLRIVLSALHEEADIEQLLDALALAFGANRAG